MAIFRETALFRDIAAAVRHRVGDEVWVPLPWEVACVLAVLWVWLGHWPEAGLVLLIGAAIA